MHGMHGFVLNSFDLWAIGGFFFAALLAAFGHCAGMCGGIVLAYCSRFANYNSEKNSKDSIESKREKVPLLAHIFYNFGRIFTYSLLGAIFAALGSFAAPSAPLRGVLFAFCAAFMFLAGVSLIFGRNFLAKFEFSLNAKNAFAQGFSKIFKFLLRTKNKAFVFLLGVLNGLLPCGLVYAALVASISLGAGNLEHSAQKDSMPHQMHQMHKDSIESKTDSMHQAYQMHKDSIESANAEQMPHREHAHEIHKEKADLIESKTDSMPRENHQKHETKIDSIESKKDSINSNSMQNTKTFANALNAAFKGAIAMAIFGLATAIPLLLVGIFSSFILKSPKIKSAALRVCGVLLIIFGVLLAQKAFVFFGFN